uniref:Uncharacterized protein n=1 Tax=Amphiprion ocellaris TaxID=80972 RepID=A0AAQ5XFA3_AMPOC
CQPILLSTTTACLRHLFDGTWHYLITERGGSDEADESLMFLGKSWEPFLNYRHTKHHTKDSFFEKTHFFLVRHVI